MNEYLLICLKTLLFLVIILILIRIMGKRELGQLNVFDIIISFMISEIFSNAIAEPHNNIFLALFPILVIFIVQILISYTVLKSKKIRNVIESKPSIIIDNGVVNYTEMKKQRYNISDLLQQVREEGVDDLREISFAILESNGALSVIKKTDQKLLSPFPIISDGELLSQIIEKLNIEESYINMQVINNGYHSYKEVFMAFIDLNKNLVFFSKKSNNVK